MIMWFTWLSFINEIVMTKWQGFVTKFARVGLWKKHESQYTWNKKLTANPLAKRQCANNSSWTDPVQFNSVVKTARPPSWMSLPMVNWSLSLASRFPFHFCLEHPRFLRVAIPRFKRKVNASASTITSSFKCLECRVGKLGPVTYVNGWLCYKFLNSLFFYSPPQSHRFSILHKTWDIETLDNYFQERDLKLSKL